MDDWYGFVSKIITIMATTVWILLLEMERLALSGHG